MPSSQRVARSRGAVLWYFGTKPSTHSRSWEFLSKQAVITGSRWSTEAPDPEQLINRLPGARALPRSSGRVLSESAKTFLAERHLATVSTQRPDGSLHAVPVGFTVNNDATYAWVITSSGSTKIRNIESGSRACLCQVDGRRWLSLEGPATIHAEPEIVAEAVRRYTQRYQAPRPNPRRVCLEVRIERIQGSV
jgi:F420H(2)-dependent biliverdin reductase